MSEKEICFDCACYYCLNVLCFRKTCIGCGNGDNKIKDKAECSDFEDDLCE